MLGAVRNEWLSVNSKRIVLRHKDKEKAGEGSGGAEGSKPVRCSFELIGRVAEVVKVDASMSSLQSWIGRKDADVSQLALSDEDSPLVFVHVVEPALSLSVFLWMKLSLLRVPAPRAHLATTHYPAIPQPAMSLTSTRATFAAQSPDLDALIALTTTAQQQCVGDGAKKVLQAYVEQHGSGALQLRLRDQLSLLAAQPASALSSILNNAQPSSSHVLQGIERLRRTVDDGHERVEHLVALILAAMDKETEMAREAKALPVIATSGSPLPLSRTPSHPPVPPTPRGSSAAGVASVFEGYCAELQKLLSDLTPALTSLWQSLRSFSLTSLSPSSSLSVQCEHSDVSLQLVSFLPASEAELKADKALLSPTWCIHFHADEQRTVLLKEVVITSDPSTRLFPPFLVTNPVYISTPLIKGKTARLRSKDAAEGAVTASITPFTSHSLETLYLVVELLVALRRAYSPAPITALSLMHVRRVESLLRSAYVTLTDFLIRLHRALPLPSNLKSRGYECVGRLLACLTFSHVQMVALLRRERERERAEAEGRERERERERDKERERSANARSRDARKLTVLGMEERKEASEDDSKHHRDDAHHTHPPPHPHHQPSLGRSSSSTAASLSPSSASFSSPSSSSSSASASSSPWPPSALPSSWQSEQVDLSWVGRIVLHEAKMRHVKEKPFAPLHSVYLQRLVELLLAGLRYEKLVVNSRYWEVKAAAVLKPKPRPQDKDADGAGKLLEVLRQPITNDFVVVLSLERLLLLATDPRAHPPLSREGATEPKDCDCTWCRLLEDARDQTAMAMPLVDLSPHSLIHTTIHDMDHLPDSIITGVANTSAAAVVSGDGANVPNAPPLSFVAAATSAFAGSLSTFSSIFGSNSPSSSASLSSLSGSPSSAPASLPSASNPQRSRSEEKTPTGLDDERAALQRSPAARPMAFSPSGALSLSSAASVSASSRSWRDRLHLAERLLPNSSIRSRIFNLLLNSTAHMNHARPEIAFRRGHDHSGDDGHAAASSLTAASGGPSSVASTSKASGVDDDAALQRQSMFQQLCDAFIKANFHRQASALRAEVSTVTWKTILAGALDQGAAGLPGPFRQALYEICQFLQHTATNPLLAAQSLLIPCPNSRSQTGDDRNKLLVNPGLLSEAALVHFRIFGQLLGIAIRSKCCLDLDLAECFWKAILRQPLCESDLAQFDFTAHRSLQFSDPLSDVAFNEAEFDEYLGDLTYTTVASDNRTVLALLPHGESLRVPFAERYRYRRLAIAARLHESALQLSVIREGLHSIIPEQALELLSWHELELRVCGRPVVDLETLKKHTVYSPSTYSLASPVVAQFWHVLNGFSPEEVAAFLQFAWARSRLPSEMGSYRMQLNILDKAHPQALPTAETSAHSDRRTPQPLSRPPPTLLTALDLCDVLLSLRCFFNVNLPKYHSIDVMRAKIKMALLCGTITS